MFGKSVRVLAPSLVAIACSGGAARTDGSEQSGNGNTGGSSQATGGQGGAGNQGGASTQAGNSGSGAGGEGGGSGSGNGGQGGSAGDPGTSGAGGASNAGSGGTPPSPVGADAPNTELSFTASEETFLNPERGFYTTTLLTNADDLSYVREEGKSIVYAAVHLDDYLGADHEQDLPQAVLDDVQAGFNAVRDAELKAVVRFQYDNGEGYPGGANDAPEEWIIRHVEQLTPVLRANEDVLFLMQAGLIGAWGEWHTSNNFTDGTDDPSARQRVVEAILAALPASRQTALRYPAYKRAFFGTTATTETNLLAGDAISRAGHLNDCFVSGPEDVGTYQYESIDVLKDYLAMDTAYVAIGGETCATDARNSCVTTLAEMERFHYTYINDDYHPDVLSVWNTEGCRPEIEQRLGYRLRLTSAALPEAVRPGGSFTAELQLSNDGFAALVNPRPVFLVLENETERHVARLTVDPRTWLPGAITLSARVRLPAALPEGTYRLALWLPDAASSLAEIPAYAVRLANEDVWEAAAGDNTLATITIAATAEGGADPTAAAFAVIPE